MYSKLLFAALIALSTPAHLSHGHAATHKPNDRHGGPDVVMEVEDASLQEYANGWQTEIQRRFHHAVGVLCHGGNLVGDQWIVTANAYGQYTTAQDVVRQVKAKYPDRLCVLLACNPGHLDLGVGGVYFAKDSVWCVPDRQVGGNPMDDLAKLGEAGRWADDPNVVGNIFEFVED